MIYDQHGRKIDIEAITAPMSGRSVHSEVSDRLESDVSRSLTPAKVDQILSMANSGETADQCRLAMEIEEKNWDVAHALFTRLNAVRGVDWDIKPGGESAADKKAADDFKAVLEGTGIGETDTFENLLDDMMSALLPGFSVSEIVWLPGGKGIAGFNFIDQRHFTFRDGFSPRLVTTDASQFVDIPPHKAIIHRYRKRGGDPARGGLIRPLAWLHCFSSIDFKDLLRFMERYGMPFTIAKVDQNAWDNERTALKSLIRNFGPDGGGVFTKAVELELLQASNNTGDIYFRLMTYLGDAITKVILGQTASSSDGGGLSGDNAQSEVRQDILEADCDLLAETVNAQLIAPWANWNLSPSAKRPKMIFHTDPPEDVKATAETVKTLFEAGLEADPDEMSAKFGMKLTRRAATPELGGTGNVSSAKSATKDSKALSADTSPFVVPASAGAGRVLQRPALGARTTDNATKSRPLKGTPQALAEASTTNGEDNSLALSGEKADELFAKFANVMEAYLDNPDALDSLSDSLDTDPEGFFAMFAPDLEQYLEDDIQSAIKRAKKEVDDAKHP